MSSARSRLLHPRIGCFLLRWHAMPTNAAQGGELSTAGPAENDTLHGRSSRRRIRVRRHAGASASDEAAVERSGEGEPDVGGAIRGHEGLSANPRVCLCESRFSAGGAVTMPTDILLSRACPACPRCVHENAQRASNRAGDIARG